MKRSVRNPQASGIREETVEGDVKRSIIRVLGTNKEKDFYNTVMTDKTLNNYVEDAKKRVSFLDSHNHMSTGYGYTVDAERIKDDVFFDIAILNDEEWNGMTYKNAKDLLFALRYRPFDISIGFADEVLECSVCGEEMYTPDCPHWLGEIVTLKKKEVEVIGYIDDGHLLEVSLVYDGATPGAMTFPEERIAQFTEKADTLMRAGKATKQQILAFCKRIRIPEIEVPEGVEPPPVSRKPRSKKMAKSVEALESQVEQLTEDLEEAQEELAELRKVHKNIRDENRDLKTENKALKAVQTQIEDIETEIRELCIDQHIKNLEKGEDEVTEDVKNRYKTKVGTMGYEALRAELAEKQQERDIIIALEKKEEEDNSKEGDPDPDKAGADPDRNKDPDGALQPFVAPLRNRQAESSLLGGL